jgi:hypothetical protein
MAIPVCRTGCDDRRARRHADNRSGAATDYDDDHDLRIRNRTRRHDRIATKADLQQHDDGSINADVGERGGVVGIDLVRRVNHVLEHTGPRYDHVVHAVRLARHDDWITRYPDLRDALTRPALGAMHAGADERARATLYGTRDRFPLPDNGVRRLDLRHDVDARRDRWRQ